MKDIATTVMERCDLLGNISEDSGALTRSYGSRAMREVNGIVAGWMRDAGMTVRQDAIRNIIGRYEGEGWRVVMGALANERSGISESTSKERELEALKELARNSRRNGRPLLEDASVRRQIAAFETKISAMRLNGLRNLTKQLNGQHPSSETSVNKALSNQLALDMSDLAMSLLGSEGQLAGAEQFRSLAMHGSVIGGGAPNIQRNIIAERILGLPKD